MAFRSASNAAPTQNNNNHLGDRSSTRCAKPPGGGSTVGSLIFGGDNSESCYMDDRKTRRCKGSQPEHNPIIDKDSFYGSSTANQRERERVTAAPGAVSRDALVTHQQQPQPAVRRGSSNNSIGSSDYFAGGMGGSGADSNQPRTRRMYGPPGGTSTFKLG